MWKPIKIVLVLTLVVVLSSTVLFAVVDITNEVIAERRKEEMKEIVASLVDIFPAMEDTFIVEEADPTDESTAAGITTTLLITDANGNPKGYVYFVSFQGYANTIEYMISVDAEGTIGGFEFMSMSETASSADDYLTQTYWDQFAGLSFQMAGEGEIDGVAGASFTFTYFKASLASLYDYHKEVYGITELTPEQILQAKKEALAGGSLSAYSNTNPYADYGITDVQVTEDSSVVVYTVEFAGYNVSGLNSYIIAVDTTTNTVIGYETLFSDDTETIGAAAILNPENWTQLEGTSSTDLIEVDVDGFTGATVTKNGLDASLTNVAVYHRWEFEGVKELTPEEQFEAYKQELFPTATSFEDVTTFKESSLIIQTIFDAKNDNDELVGTIYHVTTIGASYSEITFVEFLVGIDPNGTFTGFIMLDDTETEGRADAFYADGYGDSLIGDDITADIDLDAVSGSSLTYGKIVAAIEEIVTYHNEKYIGRPDSAVAETADLLAAFPTADQFVSVYEDYTFSNLIGNIYEAQDSSGTALGYVYLGYADGNGGLITFTFGVALDGTTQQLYIVSDSETWEGADHPDYGTYDNSEGDNFPTSPWLDNFEGVDIASLLTNPVDTVSGVTNTTSGMIASIETIAQYHADENVGGGN